jgi:hypothetical protein
MNGQQLVNRTVRSKDTDKNIINPRGKKLDTFLLEKAGRGVKEKAGHH